MATNSASGGPDRHTLTVTVDFAHGSVVGLQPLLESVVEFIQEDRVTAADDEAMAAAERLARWDRTGD